MTKILVKGAPYGDVGGEKGEVYGKIQIGFLDTLDDVILSMKNNQITSGPTQVNWSQSDPVF